MERSYDVIVVGGGHAGVEAAAAATRIGAHVLLVTHSRSTIGAMSCNPAIGGIGKGHLVREIDALDGVMARAIDAAGIHFRVLNASKGPAVRGPRAQADRTFYQNAILAHLLAIPTLSIVEADVERLLISPDHSCGGVVLEDGTEIAAGAVVLTAGTFLNGVMHTGTMITKGGRVDDRSSDILPRHLQALGFELRRLKTGTPARLNRRSINFQALETQEGDADPAPFSYLTPQIKNRQIACHITSTNARTHAFIRENLTSSPLFSGQIVGIGPRYCPSIEDKIVRFPDRDRHQIFLEPEGLDSDSIYPNGVSTSLPVNVQVAFLRTMEGLEKVELLKPGYAVEYDFIDARRLDPTLESVLVPRLFFAGQINGTTGYEEAGAQGIVAGVNAALVAASDGRSRPSKEFVCDRADGYIGVMIDDLTTLGVSEPYRMFTSRAEYRLLLRPDNADSRLTPKGIAVGCVGGTRADLFHVKQREIEAATTLITRLASTPDELAVKGVQVNRDGVRRTPADLLALPDMTWKQVCALWPELKGIRADVAEQVEIEARYQGYLPRMRADIDAFRKDESLALASDLDYGSLSGLSSELAGKLSAARPSTLGAASRIPGMTPAALTVLLRYVKANPRG